MENNYVLIGLIVLTVSCIYLFYTNFQKNKEYEMLVSQVNQLRIQNEENKKYLATMNSSAQYVNNPITTQNPPDIREENNILNVELDLQPNLETLVPENDSNDDTQNNNQNDLSLELNEEELEEIDNLDNLDNLVESEVVVGEELQLNDDVASVVESVLMEPVNNTPEEAEPESNNDLSNVDNIEDELVEVVTNSDTHVSNDDTNSLDNDSSQYLNMSNQNLETMTHKELKLMCKNLGLKTKGNKEVLMSKIKEKLVEN